MKSAHRTAFHSFFFLSTHLQRENEIISLGNDNEVGMTPHYRIPFFYSKAPHPSHFSFSLYEYSLRTTKFIYFIVCRRLTNAPWRPTNGPRGPRPHEMKPYITCYDVSEQPLPFRRDFRRRLPAPFSGVPSGSRSGFKHTA